MKTWPISRSDGVPYAFEIPIGWPSLLCKLLRSIPGVSHVNRTRLGDNRITFLFNGEPFVVNEPWGDSSRYWVGPSDPAGAATDIKPLHDAFVRHHGMIEKTFLWLNGAIRPTSAQNTSTRIGVWALFASELAAITLILYLFWK